MQPGRAFDPRCFAGERRRGLVGFPSCSDPLSFPMQIDKYTGGYFQTNAYALPTPGGGRLLIDAPEGSAAWLRRQGWKLDALLLTHAHIDHIQDASEIVAAHGCPIYYHADGVPLLEDRMAYRRFGLSLDFEPVTGGKLVAEGAGQEFAGVRYDVLLVPGHCPGSLCFYDVAGGQLYGGDVLFAGSIGRTDLPGGDHALLLRGIREKVLTLPDDVVVHPGHGPETTIARERKSNPYVGNE